MLILLVMNLPRSQGVKTMFVFPWWLTFSFSTCLNAEERKLTFTSCSYINGLCLKPASGINRNDFLKCKCQSYSFRSVSIQTMHKCSACLCQWALMLCFWLPLPVGLRVTLRYSDLYFPVHNLSDNNVSYLSRAVGVMLLEHEHTHSQYVQNQIRFKPPHSSVQFEGTRNDNETLLMWRRWYSSPLQAR